MSRLFNFEGCDAEYIRFLESKLLESQRILVHDSNSSLGAPVAPQPNQNAEQDTPEIQIVLYEPKLDKTRANFGQRTVPKWKKQLKEFISSIPREKDWGCARYNAGIYTIQRNRWAIQLMLGRTTESIFPSQDALAAGLPSIQPADNENKELILRGCKYGKFISACADEGNFALRVTEYQKLIFTSYCAVLMHAGNSKETVYSMMRQYINKEYDDKTLDNYRYGAVWVNRCIAFLLKQGWGHRSWEIFLLRTYLGTLIYIVLTDRLPKKVDLLLNSVVSQPTAPTALKRWRKSLG